VFQTYSRGLLTNKDKSIMHVLSL